MKEERTLAIDYGEKRVGIAVTDPLNLFAYPLTTLNNDNNLIKEIIKIIEEKNVVKVVLGNPLKESGEQSKFSETIEKFSEKLGKQISVPIEMFDERYTSELAKQRILETVSSKKKRRDKSLVDKNAAAILLEDYMKSHS